MTAETAKSIRARLGFSLAEMGTFLGYDDPHLGRRRAWDLENGRAGLTYGTARLYELAAWLGADGIRTFLERSEAGGQRAVLLTIKDDAPAWAREAVIRCRRSGYRSIYTEGMTPDDAPHVIAWGEEAPPHAEDILAEHIMPGRWHLRPA